MTIAHPKIQLKIRQWQTELRFMTGNEHIELYAVGGGPARSLGDVQEAVQLASGLNMYQILERTRKKEIVSVRQLLCYCMRKMCKMTYPSIAAVIGYNDHTSVMHCEGEVAERLRKGDLETASVLKKVERYFEYNQLV
jgi:hypothetical protein